MNCFPKTALRLVRRPLVLFLFVALFVSARAFAQGVTTGSVTGLVTNAEGTKPVVGATVVAVHEPSGTVYEGVTREDGRFSIPGMRVGGPYMVNVSYSGAGEAFQPETQRDVIVHLGEATDLSFKVKIIAVKDAVTVIAEVSPIFSPHRTGAGTSIGRTEIGTLPTVTGRINDVTRLTPQSAGMSFAGQDNRLNNITVDGAYFNNSFGLGNQPGDRTGVAPISLESIEQIQVHIAPYDVREGNFLGANVNTVTRSGTNHPTGSVYHRFRNDSFVGTTAKGLAFNPGAFDTKQTGFWAGGPILKSRLFFFGNFENESDVRPLTTFRANQGGEAVGGNITRVLASDLTALSNYLETNFKYTTGPFDSIDKDTPAKRYLIRSDLNINKSNKVNFRYSQLDSSSDTILSGSSSAGFGRRQTATDFLSFQNSNYAILENIKSVIGEWNSILNPRTANNFIAGFTTNDESRRPLPSLFPFVDIQNGDQKGYTAFGSEPFTPNNELRYKTFQIKDDVTRFATHHTWTFGGTLQRYHSENVFFPLRQSAYVYNTLADFFTDANDYLANPNRTSSPVTLRRFQVRYTNIPGQEKPIQPLIVFYGGGYVQDQWRVRKNLTIMGGLRVDVSRFKPTAYDNPAADALTFRDETGAAVQYNSGALPKPKALWSPRVGFNWDVMNDQRTQVRGGTGVFTGPPLYVWISNQVGNTGLLTGFIQEDNTTARPFHPDTKHYWPASVTGSPAPSFELDVTDPNFKFPQLWRSNIAIDRKLPGGLIATAEYIYNRDVNGIYYINANLPAAQSAFTGVDNRPRWVGPSCNTPAPVPCQFRINNAQGNQITSAIVMKNEDVGFSWNTAVSLMMRDFHGFTARSAYSYGVAKNTIDPGSTANASFTSTAQSADPNNPGLAFSNASSAHRFYIQGSYTRQYFHFGATTVAVFWETRTGGNTNYVFSGDMNGDNASANDLIYIPRDQSEMNFVQFASGGKTFTVADQAAAFEAYILQDPYLSKHRGEYAARNAFFLPRITRMDLSFTQDIFRNIRGRRNSGQVRIDILNLGNLINSDWGVSQRLVQNQILTNAAADGQGRVSYRLAVVDGNLITKTFQTNAGLGDVYSFMLSFRYTFN